MLSPESSFIKSLRLSGHSPAFGILQAVFRFTMIFFDQNFLKFNSFQSDFRIGTGRPKRLLVQPFCSSLSNRLLVCFILPKPNIRGTEFLFSK